MQLIAKLGILADAAKYDASCASSGAPKRNSRGADGLGATNGMGICHSYTPDGRCVSLLKVLLTNFCLYDCQYCVNRRSSNVPRARFSPEEVVRLTLDFYRRNCISGLFLSSGIIRSADYTMEQLIRVARLLREEHSFRGYIHLKAIPDADPLLIEEAGRLADRLSVNIELPTDASLKRLAPEKQGHTIRQAMGVIHQGQQAVANEPRAPRFTPAGQSTQVIVGADSTDDSTLLRNAESLYQGYGLKRVYYSAFSPIPDSPGSVPLAAPPLLREHRLYQADFLLRGYGYKAGELLGHSGNLALDIDPKLAWALANRAQFPVDVARAPREMLLRVPGFGTKTVGRILTARRNGVLRYADLLRMGAIMSKAQPFVTLPDWTPGALTDSAGLRARFAPPPEQLSLFG